MDFIPVASSLQTRSWRLARRRIAVRRRAILMIAKGQRPHPRHANWHSGRLHDAANDGTVAEHVVVVIVPVAGGARSRRAWLAKQEGWCGQVMRITGIELKSMFAEEVKRTKRVASVRAIRGEMLKGGRL